MLVTSNATATGIDWKPVFIILIRNSLSWFVDQLKRKHRTILAGYK